MKKIFSFIAIALLVVALASTAFAWDNKYVIANNTATKMITSIPTTIIIPGKCRILRFEVTNAPIIPALTGGVSTEVVAALYDCLSAVTILNNNLEGEIESNDSDSVTERYDRPLQITNGVTIVQGAYTIVMIEWERVVP